MRQILLSLILLFELIGCTLLHRLSSDHQDIEVSNHLKNYIADIPIVITNSYTEINLHNAASAEIINLDFKNSQDNPKDLENLSIRCMSYCPIHFKDNAENLRIKNLYLTNAYFLETPQITIGNVTITNSEATYTALPKVTGTAAINIITSHDMKAVQNLLHNVNIVPASGEFVYDTKIIYDLTTKQPINQHTDLPTADALYNLDSLLEHCPNLKWAAPVVAWFGVRTTNSSSLDVRNLKIIPGVDNKYTITSEPWKVAKYDRKTAYLTSKNEYGHANYGGTINDESLLRYIEELKSRNLKIMFYPMVYMDLPNKPWRGSIVSDTAEKTQEFFHKKDGYNEFILHYANLLKGKVNAFVIGSEMQGLTQSTDSHYKYPDQNHYPAVKEFITLAKEVKQILGPDVTVTYAANWSEYHHDNNLIHHLDPLWASDSVDVVGIDAYLPITNKTMGDISVEDIKNGWTSGELWHYYYDRNKKKDVSPPLGLKQIEYWWSHHHWSQGIRTNWKPRMKPIWFTEFGFPSMHLATNTPHAYWDPKSQTENIPKKSSGRPDFAIQSRAIRATIEYWNTKPTMVQNMFLWAWDARPFPYFPNRVDIWSDGEMWSRGHLINGKIYPVSQVRIRGKAQVQNFITNADTLVLEENNNIKNISAKKIEYIN